MKISPQQYAQMLAESVSEENLKNLSKAFWHKLQKNGQYKDLSKIIDALDQEHAKLSGKIFALVYSGTALSGKDIRLIEDKLKKQFQKEITVKNIVDKNQSAGIIVRVDGTEIDLCLENKIKGLKNALNSGL